MRNEVGLSAGNVRDSTVVSAVESDERCALFGDPRIFSKVIVEET